MVDALAFLQHILTTERNLKKIFKGPILYPNFFSMSLFSQVEQPQMINY